MADGKACMSVCVSRWSFLIELWVSSLINVQTARRIYHIQTNEITARSLLLFLDSPSFNWHLAHFPQRLISSERERISKRRSIGFFTSLTAFGGGVWIWTAASEVFGRRLSVDADVLSDTFSLFLHLSLVLSETAASAVALYKVHTFGK